MNNGCKISLKYVSALILTFLFFCITINSSARYYKSTGRLSCFVPGYNTKKNLTLQSKTRSYRIQPCWIPFLFIPTVSSMQIDTLHIPVSKDTLDAPISYSAQDSVVLDVPTKNITLYNKVKDQVQGY